MYQRDFLGCGWKFPLQIDPRTGHFAMSSYEENIQESVGIILRTYQGERVMRPEFGTQTADYTFAAANDSFQESLSYDLRRQLVLQEPRIQDISVSCEQDPGADGMLKVNIAYTVRSTNNRYNHVYPFYLKPGADGTI